jgi:starch synthase
LNILFVAAEAVPFAKVGGMADVVGSLPRALRKQGIDARVLMPGYGLINHDAYKISLLFSFELQLKSGIADVHVYSTVYDDVPFYFVQVWPYFGNDHNVYTEWSWDSPRFILLNQIAIGAAWELGQRLGWFPDVFHVNDWHTGLIPFLIHKARGNPIWAKTVSLLSIHNLAYQGDHIGGWLWNAGISGRDHPDLIYQNLTDNLLAIAIAYSDIVTTVSPRYATEIQYPYMGYGLDGLIRTRQQDLYGILNGIDTDLWNPATDAKLVQNFDADNFEEKRIENKRHLQQVLGLEVRDDVMLIGFVSRLVWQKGVDLAIPALRRFLAGYEAQFVALGTGDYEYEHGLWQLAQDYHWKVRSLLQYNASIAQHIYSGSDIFLMPSHFEPCGTSQMFAMRYGSLPLVRETGGLADTVINYDNGKADRGTGFLFQWEEPSALFGTLQWALQTFQNRPDDWQRMQKRAMNMDFSWDGSAQKYINLYQKALDRKRGAHHP